MATKHKDPAGEAIDAALTRIKEKQAAGRDFIGEAWRNGHESGYRDAVSELWNLAHEAHEAGDLARELVIMDLATQVRSKLQHHADSYPAARTIGGR